MGRKRPPDNPSQTSFNWDGPGPEVPLNGHAPKQKKPSLIQPARARAVTEDAIRRAEFLTGEQQRRLYYDTVVAVAREQPTFRADMVWEKLGRVGDGQRDDGSALGPVMRQLLRDRIIEHVLAERSQRPSMHGKHQTLWRSLIYQSPSMKNIA